MEFQKNSLREKIKGGEIALGTALYSFSPAIIEVAGYAGLDFCRIDNEHAWRQDESAENVIRGALLSGIVPLLRIDRDNPFLVRKALEAGAGGVIVPHVHTQAEAEEIVQAAKFPPWGKRGYGGLCLSGQWGVNGGTEWMAWSNAETLIIPMIEDIAAIPNIEAILSTEGVDAVFFGPADFSISAGVPLQTGHEKVMSGLRKTIEAADKYGKFVIYPGAGFPQWETVHKAKELGVKAIELGHDVTILRAVWSKTIQALKTGG
ncbi:MAG: aldolase/citrate lyase family protein [Smithellaceae bacterium]|nr:aldolase/citrate lyase family protein [Smithellaceae bacterium]